MSYDFDNPIDVPDQEERSEFFVFDDGDVVSFEVTDFKKAISSNNNRMAKLELRLFDAEGNEAKAFEKLVLCEKMVWQLRQFFASIGQCDPDVKVLNPRWNEVNGATGKCKVKVETYEKNGKTRRINKVAEWLPPETRTAKTSAPQFVF